MYNLQLICFDFCIPPQPTTSGLGFTGITLVRPYIPGQSEQFYILEITVLDGI